ncbi:MAG: ISKra4 family transposase [Ktedonobacteraceae bacterium]
METNEKLKTALLQEAEKALVEMIEQLQTVTQGDLQTLEQRVLTTCIALGRTMLEHILQHAAAEGERTARRDGDCGHRQRLVGMRPRQLHTLMGKVTIHRAYYQCLTKEEAEGPSCSHGQAPYDAEWGPVTGRTSPGVQRLVGKLVARMTLSEALETFTSILPLPMSERQILNLIQPVGEALREREEEQVQSLFEQAGRKETHPSEHSVVAGSPIRRLYIETDGVTARMRRGSVAMEEPETTRTGDVYREMKVGAVFEGLPGRERSDLVPGVFLDEPGPITYLARRMSAEEFGPFLYTVAHRCGLDRALEVVILGDGARWIRRLVEEHFPFAVQIVDLYHAREHVWHVANAVYGPGTTEGAAWANQANERLSQGEIDQLIQLIEMLPVLPAEPGTSRSLPEIEADYFRSNAERMRYPLFRAKGMHIGSGIAEAACKTVVSTRAKRSGMRWTPEGLDAVLALRTSVLNLAYDSFWEPSDPLLAA